MRNRLNCVRIEITGFNLLRLLKALTSSGIKLENVEKIKNDGLNITIKGRYKAKTFAILKKLCYNYTVKWDYSIRSILSLLLKRLGLIVGAVIGIAFCLVASRLVIGVKAVGLSGPDAEAVRLAIVINSPIPTMRDGVNLKEVERIALNTGLVASVSVKISGNYLVVSALPIDPQHQGAPEKSEIVATDDAIVTRIIAGKGTPIVSVGSVVKKGDVLVSGEVYDTTGENLLATVRPNAIVYGEVVERKSVVLPKVGLKKRRTGKKTIRTEVLAPYQTPISLTPYDSFDREQTESRLTVILPLRVIRTVYYETVFEKIEHDPETEAERLLKEMTAFSPSEVKSQKYDLIPGDSFTVISAYVTRERVISG